MKLLTKVWNNPYFLAYGMITCLVLGIVSPGIGLFFISNSLGFGIVPSTFLGIIGVAIGIGIYWGFGKILDRSSKRLEKEIEELEK